MMILEIFEPIRLLIIIDLRDNLVLFHSNCLFVLRLRASSAYFNVTIVEPFWLFNVLRVKANSALITITLFEIFEPIWLSITIVSHLGSFNITIVEPIWLYKLLRL